MTGKTVLVTGASSGIGQAICRYLNRLGARIVAVARNQARLEETVASLSGEGHEAIQFDLSRVEDIPAWLKGVVQRTGRLYGLVHSAGVVFNEPLKVFSYDHFQIMQRLNVDAGLMLVKAFSPKPVRAPDAAVVLVSSVAAFKGKPSLAGYSATKGALVAATKVLGRELAGAGVRVNCVCPGLVETPMAFDLDNVITPEQLEALRAEYPLGFGMPDDVAYATAFLLAPSARWITGTALVLDGGYSA
jgi:NAD(P)-dependent dehydrogenase (short-subunit alcohol dehydrogenase family)